MQLKTLPNVVTGFGFVLTAIYAWAYLTSHSVLVLPAFLLAGSTDLLDGYLARRLNQISPLGACLDPIRDRLLSLATLVNLVLIYPSRGVLGSAVTIVVFELGIIALNTVRGFPQPVHPFGRVRNGIQATGGVLLLSSYYAHPFLREGTQNAIFTLMAICSCTAFLGYATRPPATPATR